MKVTRDGDRILVDMTVRESVRFSNFAEYASRPGMDWSVNHAVGYRALHVDEDTGRSTAGLVQIQECVEGIAVLLDHDEQEAAFGLQ